MLSHLPMKIDTNSILHHILHIPFLAMISVFRYMHLFSAMIIDTVNVSGNKTLNKCFNVIPKFNFSAPESQQII